MRIRTRFPLPMLTVAVGRRVRDWFEQLSASCLKSALQTPACVTNEDVLAIRQMIEMLEQAEGRTVATSHRKEDPC